MMKNNINHLAIMPDGNGRWAKAKGLSRHEGHVEGCKVLELIPSLAIENKIKYLTLFVFSTENWQRPKKEVDGLMQLFINYLEKTQLKAKEVDICVRVIGDRNGLPDNLVKKINEIETDTAFNKTLYLQIALNYGGRNEILRAVNRIIKEYSCCTSEILDEPKFTQYLDTSNIPNPDLFIRTGGELRLSNYLLWQFAYTELYFTDILWPDFNEVAFLSAINSYYERSRRFGKI